VVCTLIAQPMIEWVNVSYFMRKPPLSESGFAGFWDCRESDHYCYYLCRMIRVSGAGSYNP
jgi:hypothetical protein